MSSDELTTIAKKAARGGMFVFIGNASSTVILAVGAILVARLLGPSNYGLYTLATVLPLLLVSLSDVGMNLSLVRLPFAANFVCIDGEELVVIENSPDDFDAERGRDRAAWTTNKLLVPLYETLFERVWKVHLCSREMARKAQPNRQIQHINVCPKGDPPSQQASVPWLGRVPCPSFL